ncbi:MAG: hypothetical protein ACHQ9S_13265 [Candidatus Binatia bacterium]
MRAREAEAVGHSVLEEWVYNDADIDGATMVWAREMEPDRNRALVEYFKDRKIGLLNLRPGRNRP